MYLGIYGAGGLGREIMVLAQHINNNTNQWDDIFFINDTEGLGSVYNEKVISFTNAIDNYDKNSLEIIIAVGEPSIRHLLREKVKDADYKLAVLVHPSASISERTKIGEGTIISYNCFISCDVTLGENILLQPCASIGHDSKIGSDTVISTFVSVAGGCTIGNETYIGMNVPVKEKVVIGNQSIIGMGSAVTQDIPDNVIALGNPARAMKHNIDHRVFKAKK